MAKLNRELRDRLYCIYRYSNKTNSDNILSLNEKHGIPDVVDTLVMTFGDILTDILKERTDAGITDDNIKIQTPSFMNRLGARYDKLPLFFDRISIQISYDLKAYGENFRFGYTPAKNINSQTGKLSKVTIVGNIFISKNQSIPEIVERAMALFAHEMIHAYEDYKLQKSEKGSLMKSVENRGYYRNTGRTERGASGDKQRFSYIIYYLTPEEIRSYTAQIIKNIEPKIKYCSNSQEAFNLVKNTVTWKNYLAIELFLNNFAHHRFKDADEGDIEFWWHEITGKNSDYESIISYLQTRLEKTKKKLINVIGKRIYDAAVKNGLWGMTDDTDNLINV